MKSKLNDASLIAESYASMFKRSEDNEQIAAAAPETDAQRVERELNADEDYKDDNVPMVAVVDVPEPAEENHPDDSEVNMAMAELFKIGKYAAELAQLLQGVPALEGWTAAKITKAADYLGSVFHKLDYDVNGHSMHNTGYEDAMEDGE